MPKPATDRLLESFDHRLSNVEQFLPTLATKDELQAAIAPLATKEELRAAIAPLATREELHAAIAAAVAPLPTRDEMHQVVRAEGEVTRRHFDVVAESLRADIRLIAEGHLSLAHRMDTSDGDTKRAITGLDRRVLRLETERSR